MRKVLHPLGLSSEPYRVFTDGQIRHEFERHGFRIVRRGPPDHGKDAHMRVYMEKPL